MDIKDIQPTKGHVLVELFEPVKEVGGIVLAGNQQNNAPVRGTILRTPEAGSSYVVGEHIFFRKYAIDELKFTAEGADEMTVYIIDEREILGVVRPSEKEEVDVPEEEVRSSSRAADDSLKRAVVRPAGSIKKE